MIIVLLLATGSVTKEIHITILLDPCDKTGKFNMLCVAVVLLLLSKTSAKKVLLRLTNDSKPNLVDDTYTQMKPRRSILSQWLLKSEQGFNTKSNGWEMYMSISLPSIPSVAPPSYPSADSPESSSRAPSYTLINDTLSVPPYSSSNSPTNSYAYPDNTTIVPSNAPQSSTVEVPSTTEYPTNRNTSISASPSNSRSMYPASAVPSTSEGRNDTALLPAQTVTPSMEDLRRPTAIPTSTMVAIFECKPDNVVGLAVHRLPLTTQLGFKIGYSVESSSNESEYIDAIEYQILVTAVAGALQCENGGEFFTDIIPELMGRSSTLSVAINTTRINETCLLSPISQCKIFETAFQVVVNGDLDADAGQFLGYLLLKDKMEDGTLVELVPNVDRCEYLSPLPLLPPVSTKDGSNQQINQDESERLSVSPWSLATLSLLCEYFYNAV